MTSAAVLLWWFVWGPEIEAATFPPEAICEKVYRALEREHGEARCLWLAGGSWPLKCRMDETRERMALIYAAWWVTWNQSTPADRRWWLKRYREIERGDP